MSTSDRSSVADQLRRAIKDGIDYLKANLELLQARFAELTLSGFVFILQITFAFLLILASFIILNIALGIWLAQVLGNPLYSLLILGALYLLIAWLTSRKALAWLNKLKS